MQSIHKMALVLFPIISSNEKPKTSLQFIDCFHAVNQVLIGTGQLLKCSLEHRENLRELSIFFKRQCHFDMKAVMK